MLHTLRFSLQNAVYFIMLPFLVPVLFTFYIQVCYNLNVKLRCQKVKGHSCNYRCNGKSNNITYSECVFVSLGIQHEMGHIAIGVLSGSTVAAFPHYLKNGTIFKTKNKTNVIRHKMRVLIFSANFV